LSSYLHYSFLLLMFIMTLLFQEWKINSTEFRTPKSDINLLLKTDLIVMQRSSTPNCSSGGINNHLASGH
jgi:regulatory protein YycI of two-component signal transduction system YycFG